ncbi:MAG: sigma-E processing peptidase SpoIIGA [Bacillus sp. (in: firmicutes)]
MVAYVDLIFLLNTSFDCLLLYWTSLLLKRKTGWVRIFAGGLLGALFILLYFTPYYYLTNSVLLKFFVSLLMILVTFGYHRMKFYVKACLFFYLVTFLAGGILMGLHFLFSYKIVAADVSFFYGTKSFGDPISWLFVMIGFPAGWIFSARAFSELESSGMLKDQFVTVTIKIKDTQINCVGFIDTGNQLHEPFTNVPVMILSVRHYLEQLPADVAQLLRDPSFAHDFDAMSQCFWGERVRIIPYKVVGQEQQMLLAFRPDWIEIEQGGKKGMVNKGLVAMSVQTLSHEDAFRCIVHPRMMGSLIDRSVS